MKYSLSIFALMILLSVVSVASADTYTVSGEVQYTGTGLLLLKLVDEAQFTSGEIGNGELDEGSMGPSEPWAIHGYKPSVWSGPRFKQSKIEVSVDVAGIVLVMND